MNMSWQEHYLNPCLNTQDSSILGEQGVVWLQCKHPLTHSHGLLPLYFHLSTHTLRISAFEDTGEKKRKKTFGPVWTGVFHHIWMRGGQFAFWMQSHMQWCNITLPTLFSCSQGAGIPRRVVVVGSAMNDTQRSSCIPTWPYRGGISIHLWSQMHSSASCSQVMSALTNTVFPDYMQNRRTT